MKKIFAILPLLLLFTPFRVFASDEDFLIDTSTNISYTNGNDFVTVETEYIRTVKSSSYYFPATGEKVFHIPDMPDTSAESITTEREYKIDSLSVTDTRGNTLNYSIEEKDPSEGLYVSIPNYRSTTSSSPYKILLSYNTHDYVTKIGDYIHIVGTSLPEDTVFEREDSENGTLTLFNYNFSITTDQNTPPLAKAYPDFSVEESDEKKVYSFEQTDRIGNSPSLEFGTNVMYRFQIKYTTPKTDSFVPKEVSSVIEALSTNIFEISLPREFSETNQKVYFESISPTPKNIQRDTEGNMIAMFEVPANQEGEILVEGYISVSQEEYSEDNILDISFEDYITDIQESSYLNKYLKATQYWNVDDEYIIQEADSLKKDLTTLYDIVSADYQYVNEQLEYSQSKVTSENTRIGALNALQGGASVCMEYADVMISLLRAQGIPARAAIGYTNLSVDVPTEDQVRHQWVQIWVPDYGWISIDPTFESKNMKIGQMIERVLWETFNDDSLSNIKVYSANNIRDLTSDGYSVKIYGVDNVVETEDLDTYSTILPNTEIKEGNNPSVSVLGNTVLKTTTLGKALLITVPILIAFAIITFCISIITKLVKNYRRKNS